jgi:hypothetical protein
MLGKDMIKNIKNHHILIIKIIFNTTYLWYLNLLIISSISFFNKNIRIIKKYLLFGVFKSNFLPLKLKIIHHKKFIKLKPILKNISISKIIPKISFL